MTAWAHEEKDGSINIEFLLFDHMKCSEQYNTSSYQDNRSSKPTDVKWIRSTNDLPTKIQWHKTQFLTKKTMTQNAMYELKPNDSQRNLPTTKKQDAI